MIDPHEYHEMTQAVSTHFLRMGAVEVPTSCRLSILAACENVFNISSFSFLGNEWPHAQTGQMWLEYELLKNPVHTFPGGIFCQTTSWREEKDPIPGRHDFVFPLFEYENDGGYMDLKGTILDLLKDLGYPSPVPIVHYEEVCEKYHAPTVEHAEEQALYHDFGSACLIEKFPERSDPFWNMKRDKDGYSEKIDVILSGMETIGSAVRSNDVEQMKKNFYDSIQGKYAQTLFDRFGKERTLKELEEYLKLDFRNRFGFGIGMTRLLKSLKKENLLKRH